MSTQRHTLKTPPAKAARKLFKTVPQYLAWVRNAASDLQAREENNANLMRNLIRQIASRILIRARAQDDYFRQLFQMPEGFPKRITMKKMLVLNKAGEYTLKLPLVHNGPLRTFHVSEFYHFVIKINKLLLLKCFQTNDISVKYITLSEILV